MNNGHTFHIPVLGIGFSVDTPLKVSHLGIDSVMSLCDDILLEKLRKMYSDKFKLHYDEITDKVQDFRAKRITAYLDLMNQMVDSNIQEVKDSMSTNYDKVKDYIKNLPEASALMQDFEELVNKRLNIDKVKEWVSDKLRKGSLDVNIMTKVDRDNYVDGEKLPIEFNDAHAAVRGFANSTLESAVILSAGMSPRLYSYFAQFEDFYPSKIGYIKKKIILKVSDYRSALIQGQFLAKKGIWVSEYRVESGLNCGGHAFATEGHLIGPILEDFKTKRNELAQTVFEILKGALEAQEREVPEAVLSLKVSAQGGVGTNEEHEFLLDYYNVDSVGWGTPFLLVPEVTNVDQPTIHKLIAAKEEDLYLSGISPLGVPFNNLRDNTKDIEKLGLMTKGRPGSPCPKKYLALNKSYNEEGICTASREFQHLKLKELEGADISKEEYNAEYEKITEKACICTGLGTSALLNNDIETRKEGAGISVCPGPNMAYFSKQMSLNEIVNHIYGRLDVISRDDRPNMYLKELSLYVDYLKKQVGSVLLKASRKDEKKLIKFANNLQVGIVYYQEMFDENIEVFKGNIKQNLESLKAFSTQINVIVLPLNID
jgi:hypothetical protein